MKKFLPALIFAGIAAAVPTSAALIAVQIASGLARPIALVQSPDPSDTRLFIVEARTGSTGRIRIYQNNTLSATPFVSVTGVAVGNEQGLLGMAFHPNYPATPYVYVNFTEAGTNTTVIRRYTRSTTNPDLLDPASAFTIMRIGQPFDNHNGGTIRFGSDGFLYIGMGDGGSGNDPGNRAQNLNGELLGKMLRIDVDRDDYPADPNKNYGIPAGNPFSTAPEVWAYGIRNPWKWDFDHRRNNGFGGMFIADVGQNAWEEIDYARPDVAGLNYGWRVKEGKSTTGLGGGTGPFMDPIFDYSHSGACSISGGQLYRGTRLGTDYYGAYFWADLCAGKLQRLNLTWNATTKDVSVGTNISELTTAGQPVAIETDRDGELYLITFTGNAVYRIDTTAPSRKLSAQINWNGLVDGAPRPDSVLVRIKDGLSTLQYPIGLQSDGKFRLPAPAGAFTIAIKGGTWLQRVRSTGGAGGDVTNLVFEMINGNIDGDDTISILDYSALSSAFDSVPGDANWNVNADLDRDGAVSILDYSILSDNFDLNDDVF